MLWWPAKAAQLLDVAIPPKRFTVTALSKIKVQTLIAKLLQKLARIQWSSEASYTLLTQMTNFGPPTIHVFEFQSFSDRLQLQYKLLAEENRQAVVSCW